MLEFIQWRIVFSNTPVLSCKINSRIFVTTISIVCAADVKRVLKQFSPHNHLAEKFSILFEFFCYQRARWCLRERDEVLSPSRLNEILNRRKDFELQQVLHKSSRVFLSRSIGYLLRDTNRFSNRVINSSFYHHRCFMQHLLVRELQDTFLKSA